MARLTVSDFIRFCCGAWLLAQLLVAPCSATTISTHWGDLCESVAAAIELYSNDHGGSLPPNIDTLFTGSTKALLEEQLGGPVSSKILLFSNGFPLLDRGDAQVLAVVSFPIEEDRRQSVGRYVIFKEAHGRIRSRWEAEAVIQTAAASANIVIPFATVFREKPLKVLDPDYSARLVEDAVKHGVPIKQAVEAVEKHVDDVSNRRVKAAATWAEIAVASKPDAATPEASTPVPTATPTAVAQTSSASSERNASVWPWLVGILALVVIVAVALKRRA